MKKNQLPLYLFIFLILESVAYVNAYVVDLKAASVDSNRFQDLAAAWARNGSLELVTDAEFFIQYLGLIFRFFGDSEFIATQFGLAALMCALIGIQKIMVELRMEYVGLVLLVVAVWPSSITRVTTTMREPYLIMFLVYTCFFLLMYTRTNLPKYSTKAILVAFFGSIFHKGFAVLFIGILVYMLISNDSASKKATRKKFLTVVLVVGSGLGIYIFKDALSNVKGLKPIFSLLTQDTEYMNRVTEYKANRDFRTTYDASMDFDSLLSFVTTAPLALVYYMFSPFPWMISKSVDAFAFLEGCLRAISLIFLVVLYKNGQLKPLVAPTAVILMLCFVWAAGTANYGTASRHHITTNWYYFMIIAFYLSSRKRVNQQNIRVKSRRSR